MLSPRNCLGTLPKGLCFLLDLLSWDVVVVGSFLFFFFFLLVCVWFHQFCAAFLLYSCCLPLYLSQRYRVLSLPNVSQSFLVHVLAPHTSPQRKVKTDDFLLMSHEETESPRSGIMCSGSHRVTQRKDQNQTFGFLRSSPSGCHHCTQVMSLPRPNDSGLNFNSQKCGRLIFYFLVPKEDVIKVCYLKCAISRVSHFSGLPLASALLTFSWLQLKLIAYERRENNKCPKKAHMVIWYQSVSAA